MIADIANNVMASAKAFASLYHIANMPGTFREFRAGFGSTAGAQQRQRYQCGFTIDDPPAQIFRGLRGGGYASIPRINSPPSYFPDHCAMI